MKSFALLATTAVLVFLVVSDNENSANAAAVDARSVLLNCGQSSSAKNIIFDSKNEVLTTNNTCTYTVRPYSQYVCQLRIDFTTNLPQSTPSSGSDLLECTKGLTIGLYKFCGQNNKQHIYMPFSTGIDTYEDIVLQSEPSSSWEISVTQIECPSEDIGTSFDTALIAPIGCLQYFTNSTNIIRSFNFNNGNGPYPPNLSYAICIKRTIITHGLLLHGNVFSLDHNIMQPGDSSMAKDADCITDFMSTPGMMGSNDYLLVPFATTSSGLSGYRYCGTSLQDHTLVTNMPGPFILYFNTGQYSGQLMGPAELRAFELEYRFV